MDASSLLAVVSFFQPASTLRLRKPGQRRTYFLHSRCTYLHAACYLWYRLAGLLYPLHPYSRNASAVVRCVAVLFQAVGGLTLRVTYLSSSRTCAEARFARHKARETCSLGRLLGAVGQPDSASVPLGWDKQWPHAALIGLALRTASKV